MIRVSAILFLYIEEIFMITWDIFMRFIVQKKTRYLLAIFLWSSVCLFHFIASSFADEYDDKMALDAYLVCASLAESSKIGMVVALGRLLFFCQSKQSDSLTQATALNGLSMKEIVVKFSVGFMANRSWEYHRDTFSEKNLLQNVGLVDPMYQMHITPIHFSSKSVEPVLKIGVKKIVPAKNTWLDYTMNILKTESSKNIGQNNFTRLFCSGHYDERKPACTDNKDSFCERYKISSNEGIGMKDILFQLRHQLVENEGQRLSVSVDQSSSWFKDLRALGFDAHNIREVGAIIINLKQQETSSSHVVGLAFRMHSSLLEEHGCCTWILIDVNYKRASGFENFFNAMPMTSTFEIPPRTLQQFKGHGQDRRQYEEEQARLVLRQIPPLDDPQEDYTEIYTGDTLFSLSPSNSISPPSSMLPSRNSGSTRRDQKKNGCAQEMASYEVSPGLYLPCHTSCPVNYENKAQYVLPNVGVSQKTLVPRYSTGHDHRRTGYIPLPQKPLKLSETINKGEEVHKGARIYKKLILSAPKPEGVYYDLRTHQAPTRRGIVAPECNDEDDNEYYTGARAVVPKAVLGEVAWNIKRDLPLELDGQAELLQTDPFSSEDGDYEEMHHFAPLRHQLCVSSSMSPSPPPLPAPRGARGRSLTSQNSVPNFFEGGSIAFSSIIQRAQHSLENLTLSGEKEKDKNGTRASKNKRSMKKTENSACLTPESMAFLTSFNKDVQSSLISACQFLSQCRFSPVALASCYENSDADNIYFKKGIKFFITMQSVCCSLTVDPNSLLQERPPMLAITEIVTTNCGSNALPSQGTMASKLGRSPSLSNEETVFNCD